ncbi:MAG: hypothetical protein ACSLE0_15375 [Chitinophagaceae bacterium]
MMIDLNAKEFNQGSVSIFNNGEAGLVKNVKLSVEKKQPTDAENRPDYKVIVSDENGSVNQGFYYYTPNAQDSPERQETRATQEVSRVLHIARAVLGNDYAFPAVTSAKNAYDVLFDLVIKNLEGKLFNVFVTYGTISRPNKKGYMGLRYFNFIEPATVEKSRLRVGPQDLMHRIDPDAPKAEGVTSTTSESWI